MALRQPAHAALKVPLGRTSSGQIKYLTLSFAELDAEVDAWCDRLTSAGVRQGDRTLVMVKQGLPLIASVFALFKLAAVPVVIDPGMGLKNFLSCVERSRPRALLGIPLAQLVSRIFRGSFSCVATRVSASSSLAARLTQPGSVGSRSEARAVASGDLAAILFTSGSTGAPKGVCYEHGMFEAQVRLIRETYGIQTGEIDLPMLPIFALFNPALGMTTIVPEIDPRRPAAVDPAKIVQAILQENVTNSFGSPTLWRKIGDYCTQQNITLPSLRRVLCAGAPVPAKLWESSRTWMPQGHLHSPYGATEALPVSSVSAEEVASNHGVGTCVGRPVAGMTVKIIAITDTAVATLKDARELGVGEVGEIIVRGPVVTKAYDFAPQSTALAKIKDDAASPNGAAIWHRMGDCGTLDADGRLWFWGRKAERVITLTGTLYTEPCERVFRVHPRVVRCALVGIGERGQQTPAVVIETAARESRGSQRELADDLRQLARANPITAGITRFYFHPKFPVDVRHNAKIHRLTLARWAAESAGIETGD
jgi:acyl-CoA synthetase (AMP-forming)/AMP-acid ligase II